MNEPLGCPEDTFRRGASTKDGGGPTLSLLVEAMEDDWPRALGSSLASLERILGGSGVVPRICVIGPVSGRDILRRHLGSSPLPIDLHLTPEVEVAPAVEEALGCRPELLEAEVVVVAASWVQLLEPLESYVAILRRHPEVAAATGQHTPEHPTVRRVGRVLLKAGERGGFLVLRSHELASLRPLRGRTHEALHGWLLGRGPEALLRRARRIAVLPGGLRALHSARSGSPARERTVRDLARIRRQLRHAPDLRRYDEAETLILSSCSPAGHPVLEPARVGSSTDSGGRTDRTMQTWVCSTPALRCRLAAWLAREGGERASTLHYPNPSLCEMEGQLRYRCSEREGEERWCFLERSEELAVALDAARGGVAPKELVGYLTEWAPDADREAIATYVDELIDGDVLLPRYRMAAIVPSPGKEELPEERGELATLMATIADMAGTRLLGAEQCTAAAAELAAGARSDIERFDLVTGEAPLISPAVVETVCRGGELLADLAALTPRQQALQRFLEEFVERFGTRRVPLAEALEAVPFEPGRAGEVGGGGTFGSLELLPRLEELWSRGGRELILRREDLPQSDQDPRPHLPATVEVTARVSATSASNLARGEVAVAVRALRGPGSALSLGRRALPGPELGALVEKNLRADSGYWGDELSMVSVDGFGEILPAAGDIPWLVAVRGAGADLDAPSVPLLLADLTLSAEEGRLVLRVPWLDAPVLPRAFRAAERNSELPVGAFLGALAVQGEVEEVEWDWGALAALRFLPRVTVDGVTLAPARWRLAPEDLGQFREHYYRPRTGVGSLDSWRRRWSVPRHLILDGRLVDLEDAANVDRLRETLSRGRPVVLEEVFPDGLESLVDAPDEFVVRELAVPFRNARRDAAVTPSPRSGRRPGREVPEASVVSRP